MFIHIQHNTTQHNMIYYDNVPEAGLIVIDI